MPSAATPSWTEWNPRYMLVSGGILTLDTYTPNANVPSYFQRDFTLDQEAGYTVVARIKVHDTEVNSCVVPTIKHGDLNMLS